MQSIDIDVKLRIDGVLYNQQSHTNDIKEGELVFDTKDNTYGYCDMVCGNKIAIKFGCVAELGVPMSRVRRLVPALETNSLN